MELERFHPKSMLVTKKTSVMTPKFPVIDAHNHLAEPFGGGWDNRPLPGLLELLDQVEIRLYVDLDGGWGEDILNAHLNTFKAAYPDRFRVFSGVDWRRWSDLADAFPGWAAKRLRVQKARGADGLKIWKPFGLTVCDHHGERVAVDDTRLDVIWETAAELRLPVMIHVADPMAFFEPLDATNERWEELSLHPDWHFPSPPYPPFVSILETLLNLVKRNPATTFVGAHVGCYAENLAWVDQMLDECPNYYVDMSARIGELGRQPYSARRFFLKHANRILFGLDAGPDLEGYRLSYRFLETDDEYFNYSGGEIPLQGRWHVCGLYLPDDVLQKVYHDNAARLFDVPTLDSIGRRTVQG